MGIRPFRPDGGRRLGRRAERDQHGRPQGPRARLRSLQQPQTARPRSPPTSPSPAASRRAPFASRPCCRSPNSSSRLCATPSSPTAISSELADGFGTTLGAAYQARAHYLDRERFTSISNAVADVIAYANSTSGSDSNAGKYFFANGTTNGKKPVSDEALAIFKDDRRRARSLRLALWPAGGNARRRHLRRLPSVPDRARRSCRSWGPTISTFPPATKSTTAGRS